MPYLYPCPQCGRSFHDTPGICYMCELNNRDAHDVQREILNTQRELLDIASGKKDPRLLELQRIEEQNNRNKEAERLEQNKRSEIRKNFAAMIALTELSNESKVDEIFCQIAGNLIENNICEFLYDREIIYREYFDNFIIANPSKAKVYIRLLELFTSYVENTKSIYEERLNEKAEKNRVANEKWHAKRNAEKIKDELSEVFKTCVGILSTGLGVGLFIGVFTYIFQKIIFASSPYPHDQMGQAFIDGFKFGFLLIIIPGLLWLFFGVLSIFKRSN